MSLLTTSWPPPSFLPAMLLPYLPSHNPTTRSIFSTCKLDHGTHSSQSPPQRFPSCSDQNLNSLQGPTETAKLCVISPLPNFLTIALTLIHYTAVTLGLSPDLYLSALWPLLVTLPKPVLPQPFTRSLLHRIQTLLGDGISDGSY